MDESFGYEARAAKEAGFGVSRVDLEIILGGEVKLSGIPEDREWPNDRGDILYRGWVCRMNIVRVDVAAIIRRPKLAGLPPAWLEGRILMGLRKGSHGAGTWSFPGGHLEKGETVAECAARELLEETGLKVSALVFRQLTFTNDVFTVEDKHYITLYVGASWPGGEAEVKEPTKCEQWRWTNSPPGPLFLPIQNLLDDGFNPWGWNYDGQHP